MRNVKDKSAPDKDSYLFSDQIDVYKRQMAKD